jgi:DNA uptake protein ComE-like DNA-binding protein
MRYCLASRRGKRRLVLTAAALAAALPAHGEEPTAQSANQTAAMETVCGGCHTVEFVTARKRSKEQWIRIVQKMVDLGASGTDRQFANVGRYILTRLTTVKINDAPARDLVMLLNISESVANAIVAERAQHAFRDMQDLLRVPGVDQATVKAFADRIVF